MAVRIYRDRLLLLVCTAVPYGSALGTHTSISPSSWMLGDVLVGFLSARCILGNGGADRYSSKLRKNRLPSMIRGCYTCISVAMFGTQYID